MNPWSRMTVLYDTLKNLTEQEKVGFPMLEHFNLTSFESFVQQIAILPKDSAWPNWWWFTTNQADWLIGKNTCDYIFKAETFETDFAVIKNYFQSSTDVIKDIDCVVNDYHSRYTESSTDLIATMFQKDITTFGFTF